jgi:DNA-binding transcriptional LysR family regulator
VVRVRFGLAESLLAELRTGAHDLIISVVPVRGAEFETTPLYDEEFALVGSPDRAGRWLAGGATAPDPDLPVIAYAADLPIIRRWWRSVWGERPAGLNVIATVPDLRTITTMVVAGVGVSVLPTYLTEDHLADGSLVRLAEPEVPPLNTLSLVTRAGAVARDAALARLHAALLDHARGRR